jgi:nicotinamide riboside transporter PnuC
VGNGISASGADDVLGIILGLVAVAFYVTLMLLNKFITDINRLLVMSPLGWEHINLLGEYPFNS